MDAQENSEPWCRVTFLDHVLAATRNEWRCLHEEEEWQAHRSFPSIVVRGYAREAVFQRDEARMLALGYRILRSDRLGSGDAQQIRVTYSRAE